MSGARVSAIAAISKKDRGLGKNNDLLWKIPEDLKRFKDLPSNAQKYVKTLEKILGVKFSVVSLGRSRDETIQMTGPLWK